MSTEHALSDSDRALLSARADAFYSAARSQTPSDWEPFLHGVPARLRPTVLAELVIVDLVRRWQQGERPLVEQYVGRFPELGPLDRVPPKLIAEEYRARLRAGDERDVDQYRRRFPVQFPQVEEELLAVEQESNVRGKSGQFRAVNTVAPADTAAGGRTPATGTVREEKPPRAEPPRPSGVLASAMRPRTADYARLKRLGAGQFGEVWLVESKSTGIKKAMKVMLRAADDETGKRELRSLDLIKNEQHPYLLRTEDFWVDDNKLYVLMELADCTLRNWLAEHNPELESREYQTGVPVGELLHVLREAAEVLDELHAKQVMHRDIKPDNILMVNRHAKVADFGLARSQDPAVATQSIMAGSPAYMAPETWAGKFGAASDLYSLAVTYAELRQARLPVKLGPMAEIMFAHLEGQFEFRPDVFTKHEVAVVRRALAKEPSQRFASCSEFIAELVRVVGVPLSLPGYKKAGSTKTEPSAFPPLPPSVPPPPTASGGWGKETAGWEPTGSHGMGTKDWQPSRSRGTPVQLKPEPRKPVPPAKRKKTNWVGAGVAGGAVLGLVALIAFLVVGGGCTPSPTSGDDPTPSTGGTPPTHTPPTKTPPTTAPEKDPPTPPGTRAVQGAKLIPIADGPTVPEWVTAMVNGEEMRFRLIPVVGGRSFYIGERKVSNKAMKKDGPGGPNAPAVNVTAAAAVAFVDEHFSGAKGRLPTPAEWDHAAGLGLPGLLPTVTKAGGTPKVDRKDPADPDAEGKRDLNHYDLIDMAGNGREWTCGVLEAGKPLNTTDRPDGQFKQDDILVLRGRNYTLKGGLTFADLATEAGEEPQVQFAVRASPYTGFRVVLPAPTK